MSKNKTITLKATDFQYPSKEELRAISCSEPIFTLFSFPHIDASHGFFNDEENFSPKEIKKRNHLYWWNHSLENKIGSLTHSYALALVNFNRGAPDDLKSCNQENIVNRIQFDFYCETYFYFFASVRDVIAQIINVYYDIELDENKIHFKDTFISKISDISVKKRSNQFYLDTSDTINYRNKFTHRFLVTQPDYRISYSQEIGKEILSAGLGDFIKSSDLADQIKISLEQIAAFIADLSVLMP